MFGSLNAVSKTCHWSSRKLVIFYFLKVFDPPTPYPTQFPILIWNHYHYSNVSFLWALSFDCLLKLVQFLAPLHRRLLYGIGFLSAFLGNMIIGFFCSVFLVPNGVVHGIHAPMLFVEVAMILGVSFLGNSGRTLGTRSLVSISHPRWKYSP